jgi:hypothetical protein
MMTNGQTAGDGTRPTPTAGELIRIGDDEWIAGSKTRTETTHAITRGRNGLIMCSCEAGRRGQACWHKAEVLRMITAEIATKHGRTTNDMPAPVVDPIDDPNPFANDAPPAEKPAPKTKPTLTQLREAHEKAATAIAELIDAEKEANEATALAAEKETKRNAARAKATKADRNVIDMMKRMAAR